MSAGENAGDAHKHHATGHAADDAMSLRPGAMLGNGREAVVYALDDDRVVKVFRDIDAGDRARAEYATGVLLHAHGWPVALPLEVTEYDGQPALISRRVHGVDLNQTLTRAPWKIASVADQLAAVQVQLHRLAAPAQLPPLHTIVEARVRSNNAVPRELVNAALATLASLPTGLRMCHGNLHLGNVLIENGQVMLVDCSDASAGDPNAEVAHTLVRYRCARLRPGSPLSARLGSALGRVLLRTLFLRAYRRRADIDIRLVDQWVGVRAVERLAENRPKEKRRLLRLARRRLSTSAATKFGQTPV
jgi:aminoglycoside phosphotransferase (APT) family kinase protein